MWFYPNKRTGKRTPGQERVTEMTARKWRENGTKQNETKICKMTVRRDARNEIIPTNLRNEQRITHMITQVVVHQASCRECKTVSENMQREMNAETRSQDAQRKQRK